MEGEVQTFEEQGYRVDGTDAEYISGLSTLLAATIQETKESVSQIEYLFCKQLFPDFQSRLKKIYYEAKKSAEDEWKEKANNLMVQVKTLQSEKQQILEENQFLKTENRKANNIQGPSLKHGNDLEEELKRKTRDMAERRELQQSLREFLDSKASMVSSHEKRVKELEEENKLLRRKIREQHLEIEELRSNLGSKCRIIDEKEESNLELLQLIEQKEQKLKDNDETKNELLKTRQLLEDSEMENRVLTDQLRVLEHNCNRLQSELDEKNEARKRQNDSELLKARGDLEELQKEKRLFLVKLKVLEEQVDNLQADLRERSKESAEGMELHGKLLQQLEGKNAEIMNEKQKRREVIDAYKKLKSQYNYLCAKSGLTSENMHSSTSTKVYKNSLDHGQSVSTSPDNKSPYSPMPAREPTNQNVNQHNSEDYKDPTTIQRPTTFSPVGNQKPTSLSGTKRPMSHWRDTRPTKTRNGPDPHDDFLDTPLETIKESLKKGPKEEEIHHLPDPVPKDMNFESSDDETQDPGLEKPEKKGFKYVEPVRKKADRANLKGVECKQCKKFYDAVLPDGGGGNGKQNLRCEHHEGVSRHRYRFAPPLTPQGFWNIGFESEM